MQESMEEKAIKLSLEGGYKPDLSSMVLSVEKTLLDPLFWMAIAKATNRIGMREMIGAAEVDRWFADALHYYWLKLEGKNTDAFFTLLMRPEETKTVE